MYFLYSTNSKTQTDNKFLYLKHINIKEFYTPAYFMSQTVIFHKQDDNLNINFFTNSHKKE